MKKLVFVFLSVLLCQNLFSEPRSFKILSFDGKSMTINYDTDNLYTVYDETHLSCKINEIDKMNDIIDVLDENDVFNGGQYANLIQAMSISKIYGGVYGSTDCYEFEIVPCYSLRYRKVKFYAILYKNVEISD